MRISIIVVSWRSFPAIGDCLAALRRDPLPATEVIVVDDASGDGSASRLAAEFPEFTHAARAARGGFAAACNEGAARARAPLLLFLNPDTSPSAGAIDALARALETRPEAAAAGGLLVDDRGRPQGRYAPRPLPRARDLARVALLPGFSRQRRRSEAHAAGPIGAIAGACLLVRRSDFEGLGGFDARFRPAFFEDVDLCARLRAAGRDVVHEPAARFGHRGGTSVARLDAREFHAAWYGNLARYARKHHGARVALGVRLLTVVGAALRLLALPLPGGAGLHGRGPRAAALLHVASRSVLGWPHGSPSTS